MAPIAIFTANDLKRTGQTSLRNALTALDPSINNTPGYPGQLGFTTKTMSLRGLPANETLVLVNGKRRHTMSSVFYGGAMQGQSPVDLDMIPFSAVDHVEILKDGAAAQYGSDAIAGVINIILKSADHGGSAELGYNQYGWTVGTLGDYGRGGNLNYNQGFKIGNHGFLNITAEFVGNQATNNAGSVPRTQGGAAVLLYPLLANGAQDPRENGNRYRQISGQPESERQSIAYNMEVPLSDAATFYSYATYRATIPQILNAAEWTFGTRGLKGTRLEDIAKVCDIPKANILYYFGSKEELYNATLARLLDVWLTDADTWLSPERDPLEGLKGYIEAKIAFSRTRPEGSRLFAQELLSGGLMVQDFLKGELRAHVARHVAIFLEWQTRGIMAPIDPTHFLFLLWSGTQAYADMQVQYEAVLDHAPLTDADYETGVATIMTLVGPLFRPLAPNVSAEDGKPGQRKSP